MINRLCQRGILLKNGQIDFEGSSNSAVQNYLSSVHQKAEEEISFPVPKEKTVEAYIYKIRFENIDGTPAASFPVGRPWQLRVFFHMKNNFKNLFVTCGMHDKTGPVIRSTWGRPNNYALGNHEVILRENNLMFTPGEYPIYLALDSGRGQRLFFINNAGALHIREDTEDISKRVLDPRWGIIINQMETIFPE